MTFLRDVARAAGVSTMTVSRVFSEPAKVSRAVRERVLQAVSESGYLPNLVARSLS
jgi:DNA-binding LacI/PurR family transcriptional regulator